MSKENVLAIDVGTQSVRALVFDCNGSLLSMGKAIYHTPYHSPKPGYAEQHPSFYFEKLTEACAMLWAKEQVSSASIASVSVTSQRNTVVNLDKNGTPLRQAIVWLDQRTAGAHPSLHFPFNVLFSLPVLNNILNYVQSESEINWIFQHEKDIWEKTEHFLMLSGYINHKLTGNYTDSTACQVGYIPFDYKNHNWLKQSHWK
jgi:sugar (pentulose or hexulose) kinase